MINMTKTSVGQPNKTWRTVAGKNKKKEKKKRTGDHFLKKSKEKTEDKAAKYPHCAVINNLQTKQYQNETFDRMTRKTRNIFTEIFQTSGIHTHTRARARAHRERERE